MSNAALAALDDTLYPQIWAGQTFDSPQALLIALLTNQIKLDPNDFTKLLLNNPRYQEWINSTVFGRYIERNFAAFYRQSEDSFNMDMPALFRRELMRHAQFLPLGQVLFVAGNMPNLARRDKFFSSTLNPATVIVDAQKIQQAMITSGRARGHELIVNQVTVRGTQVLGFPIRHNKRTRERTRNEVLVLDFAELRLIDERLIERQNDSTAKKNSTIDGAIVLRDYEIR